MEMGILEALGISLLGISVVFAMLVVLMVVLVIFGVVSKQMKKNAVEAPAQTAAPAAAETAPIEEPAADTNTYGGDILRHKGVPDKVAALLMAITAEQSGIPLSELRFISIRELTEGEVQ